MPPPRLSRHLRPCHLPVTAKQVRCVHTTGRAKFSTTGYDTTPQTSSANGSNGEGSTLSSPTDSKNNVQAEEGPWWKKTLGRVTAFGRHADQPCIESKSELSPPRVEQSEHSAVNVEEAVGDLRRKERGYTQPATSSTTIQQHVETPQGQMRVAEWGKDHFASSEQVDMAALQQQIYQLSEQMKALQARLEAGFPTEQMPSTSAAVPRTSAMRPDVTRYNRENQDLVHPTPALRRIHTHSPRMSRKVSRLLNTAQRSYESAVTIYGTATGAFAKLPSHVVAPVAPSVLRHWRTIHRIAMMDDDYRVSSTYVKFKPTLDLLDSMLRKSLVAPPSTNDPQVAQDVAKYTETLFYGNSIVHTLDACWKRYRLSSRLLSDIATELGSFRSPMVAAIANHIREHILTVAEYAYLEGDLPLMDGIGHHCDVEAVLQRVRQSTQTNRLGLILKLESALAHRKMRVYEKETRDLTKELALISPALSLSKYKKVFEKSPVRYRRVRGPRERDMQHDIAEDKDAGQRLMRQIHKQSRSMKSSTDLKMNSVDRGLEAAATEQRPKVKDDMSSNRVSNAEASPVAHSTKSSKLPPRTDEISEQSLLEELFPETSSIPPPRPTKKNRDQYPRLQLPKSASNLHPASYDQPRRLVEQAAESIQQHGEQITVLQLTNCSTGLTEADFRRIIPKGKHLEGWRRDSDFYKVIPGRDPLSLGRLPFYYLLFKNLEAALAYQKNASRLHKLSARYQPSSILSAIPPPKGFLEDGEDITAAVSSYNLLPKNHAMTLNVLMQPYNPALRQLIERGGYQPIVPSVDGKGKPICRVLLHIEGYEPSPSDLFAAITSDAYRQGMLHPLRNESQSSIHRLRDMINLKMSTKAVSSSRPRAYGSFDHSESRFAKSMASSVTVYDDPEIQSMMGGAEEDRPQAQMNQEVMNRVYNRWVLDFEDEHSARRWSLRWHRRPLPDVGSGEPTWKDVEEARICNTEVLW